MRSNHIGLTMQFLKQVAENCGYNFSHGNLTERPFKKSTVYPLVHANIQSFSVYENYASISLSVAIIDRVNFLKTENDGLSLSTLYSDYGYTENQNYGHVLQELYARFLVELYKSAIGEYNIIATNYPISGTPFVEDAEDVVAGWSLTLSFNVYSPFVTDGRC